jgi:Ring hydroxylating alpha subunit (catalytic domain)
MSLPGSSGYPEGFKTDPQKQMVHVPRLERFGDFFFVNFSNDGEDLATYLADAGDYLNLVAEHSASGMQIVGGTQEYSIRGNWKLLTENSFDGYHAACTHSTYLEYLKNANGALGATPLAGIGIDLGKGHALVEYSAPWGRPIANWVPLWGEQGKAEIASIYSALQHRVGAERADRIAHKNRNMVIFPNLVVNDIMAVTVRTFFPTAPDSVEINAWALAPREESDWLRANTASTISPNSSAREASPPLMMSRRSKSASKAMRPAAKRPSTTFPRACSARMDPRSTTKSKCARSGANGTAGWRRRRHEHGRVAAAPIARRRPALPRSRLAGPVAAR